MDIYPYYNLDASAYQDAGNDTKVALIGSGVHVERHTPGQLEKCLKINHKLFEYLTFSVYISIDFYIRIVYNEEARIDYLIDEKAPSFLRGCELHGFQKDPTSQYERDALNLAGGVVVCMKLPAKLTLKKIRQIVKF